MSWSYRNVQGVLLAQYRYVMNKNIFFFFYLLVGCSFKMLCLSIDFWGEEPTSLEYVKKKYLKVIYDQSAKAEIVLRTSDVAHFELDYTDPQ